MENINNNFIHQIEEKKETGGMSYLSFFLIVAIAVIFGIAIGFIPSKLSRTTSTTKTVSKEKMVGIADKKTFKDQAEGVLKEGGIDGEGNFHLQRTGGESQNVYLTSTAVDLSKFLGKKVRVWGETFQGEKADWLMDVGLVEVLQ